eukprot:SM000016S01884  [mRNA]  locus=s16:461026:462283:+ [translate_table: standard]
MGREGLRKRPLPGPASDVAGRCDGAKCGRQAKPDVDAARDSSGRPCGDLGGAGGGAEAEAEAAAAGLTPLTPPQKVARAAQGQSRSVKQEEGDETQSSSKEVKSASAAAVEAEAGNRPGGPSAPGDDSLFDDPAFWDEVIAQDDLRERSQQASTAGPQPSRPALTPPPAKTEVEEGLPAPVAPRRPKLQPSDLSREVVINRMPVLTLWVSIVAAAEGYAWHEALTFGRAVASNCAQSKAARLGLGVAGSVGPGCSGWQPTEQVPVFGQLLPAARTKDGLRALQTNGCPIAPHDVDAYLRSSFKSDLLICQAAMEELAAAWPPAEIGEVAYKLYEGFRPEVPKGATGWGFRNILDLRCVTSLASYAPQ